MADAVIKVKGDISDFSKKMDEVGTKLTSVGNKMKDMGKTMSMYVTAPLVALGTASVMAFNKQEKAEMGVAAALKNVGKSVDELLPKYKKFAAEIQKTTTVGDEESLALMQLGLNMGINTDQIEQATKAAIGLSNAYNIGLEPAMLLVAKASQGNTASLSRYGIVLKEGMSDAEKFAKILEIGAGKFSLAEDAANTFAGQMQQAKNAMGDLMEQFGAIIADALKPFVAWVKQLAEKFQGLDESTKKIILIVGGLVAAIGPLMIALGFMISTIIPALVTGGALLAGAWLPITAIVLGVAGAIWLFNARARETEELINSLSSKSTDVLKKRLVELGDLLGNLQSNRLKDLNDELAANKTILDKLSLSEKLQHPLLQRQAELIKQIREEEQLYSSNYAVIEKYKKEKSAIEQLLRDREKLVIVNEQPEAKKGGPREASLHPIEIIKASSVEPLIKTKEVLESIYSTWKKLAQFSDTVDIGSTFVKIGDQITETKQIIVDLGKELSYLATDVLVGMAESLGEVFVGSGFKEAGQKMLLQVADWAGKFGAILIAAAIASEAFQKSLAGNPIVALAAGIALVVAASAVKAVIAKRNEASSGGSSGSGGGSGNQEGGAYTGIRGLFGQALTVNLQGELVARGGDLVTVFNQETTRAGY